jgi:electron transport complex protein RnfC
VALFDYFETGLPIIERVVTVAGEAIKRPGNFMVPIGTPLRAIIDYCGGLDPDAREYIILGGPMMGMTQKSLDVPLLKGTSGLLALSSSALRVPEEAPCIRCGRCLDACAMYLNPSRLSALVRAKRVEELGAYNLMDCFECAACSYVCPSNIPLVQLMRMGKTLVREKTSA